ncbi:hypothetical protein BGZ76_002846 [Entomortierella beljakovae]|nr:hypothetical protein BGZ76_002846 [Entomortierella beljakovae]
MFATTVNILRPVAVLRGAIRNFAIANPESSRALMKTCPSTFVRQTQRFSSTSTSKYLNEKEPLIDTKELTFGMAMGLCSGFLVKKLGKMMMIVIGLGFVTLQLLSSSGYIQVNWPMIERKFKAKFDVDRDGKVTANDARHGFRWLIGLLTTNFQFKSTFVGGFVLGFRYG